MMGEQNIRILITRKTTPALKKSCWLLFNDLIRDYELLGFSFNKSDLIIRFGSNEMYFTSIDDPEKLKSFEKINYIWAEELTELTKFDFIQLNLRCRGSNTNGINQLFGSLNPIDEMSWVKGVTDNPPKNTAINHSTYSDNEFLSPEYIEQLEQLADLDETYHKIYTLGQWATPKEIIFENWEVIRNYPKYEKFEQVGYGLDFGFNNPSALLELGIIDGVPYERELIYQSHLTTGDLIELMKKLIPNKNDIIVADCSEPARILEILNAGFNCIGCKKGKDSIKRGIDLIRRHKPLLDSESANLIKEIKSYKWRVDREGNVLDEPVNIHNHLMDCRRYIYQNMMDKVKVGLVTIDDTGDKPVRNEQEEAFELPDAAWQDF